MEIRTFLRHHGLIENPFAAEEARHDPVFGRSIDTAPAHPDFPKILGDIERPSTAVVFGEKGSGKTAIRLMIGRHVAQHNAEHKDRRTLLVPYDDLNPYLDRVVQHRQAALGFRKASKLSPEKMLESVRLPDHQDAILSLAVTRVMDGVLNESSVSEELPAMPDDVSQRVRSMPRHLRVDLAVLAALYDQPRSGTVASRWGGLRSKLKLKLLPPFPYLRYAATALSVIAVGLFLLAKIFFSDGAPNWFSPVGWVAFVGAIAGWGYWLWRRTKLWWLCRQISREVPAVNRSQHDLMNMLMELKPADAANQPWPVPTVTGENDSRYQLTHKLLTVLEPLGYRAIMVVCDRVDEPSLVTGKPQCMRAVIWPMFDNKFLQQERVGIKLLLPIELRHLLHRESTEFFQEARLDKQNMIDRLSWTGATLYDLCSNRLRACLRNGDASALDDAGGAKARTALRDLFESGVSQGMIVDALDQMHQPRDAFKFLYAVLQEHCRQVSDDEQAYEVPRLTLEAVRRQQAQRVQDLARGMAPA